jgi:hypothetical protein
VGSVDFTVDGGQHMSRTFLLASATLLLLAMSPSAASAAGISLAVSADPAADRATSITATGTADSSADIQFLIRAAGGAPCAAGNYLVCGYLEDSDGPDAQTSLTFPVRSNIDRSRSWYRRSFCPGSRP